MKLHVEECCTGDTWVMPIGENDQMNLKANVERWIAAEFEGELALNGELLPKLQGDYYAEMRTNDSAVVWDSGGFYLKSVDDKQSN